MLADAEIRAEQLGDAYVATEHLLIALATVDRDAKKILDRARRQAGRADARHSTRLGADKRVTSPEAEGDVVCA